MTLERFGAGRVVDAARLIEQLARSEKLENVATALGDLKEKVVKLEAALQAYVGQLPDWQP
ncbi:MAG: hypothetical protein O3C40_23720 [Planctomycetota bacterium]|nr:hypothetical protein [Planctomycetota bacterium]